MRANPSQPKVLGIPVGSHRQAKRLSDAVDRQADGMTRELERTRAKLQRALASLRSFDPALADHIEQGE